MEIIGKNFNKREVDIRYSADEVREIATAFLKVGDSERAEQYIRLYETLKVRHSDKVGGIND